MKKIFNLIKLWINPRLVDTVILPTGVVAYHYKCWNKTEIIVEPSKYYERWNLG